MPMEQRSPPGPWRLIAALLLVSGIILLWVARTSHTLREEATVRFFEQYNRQQLLLAAQAARSIEQFFETLDRDLALVAQLFRIEPATAESVAARAPVLEAIYGRLAGTPVMDLGILSPDGRVVGAFPPVPGTLGTDLSWRDYFRWAREGRIRGALHLTPFQRITAGRMAGQRAAIAARGIYGPNGAFHGVALLTVNFDELARRYVLPVRIGEHGYAWLVDSSGATVLVDPSGRANGQTFAEAFLWRWPSLYALLESTQAGRPGTGAYEYMDPAGGKGTVRKLAAWVPVRVAQRLWTLGVTTPEREVRALMSTFLQRQQAVSVGFAAVILAAFVTLSSVLLRWNRALSREVRARTADLEEARARLERTFDELLASKKLATLGQMAVGLVHEIRNPLSAIRMNMQILRKKLRNQALREHFEIVDEEVGRLNRLLTDILAFARPGPLRVAEVDLGELSARVLRLLDHQLSAGRIEVECRIPARLAIRADPERIRQVLWNLLLNAVESLRSAPPPRRLVIAAQPRDDLVVLEVSDTGPGIPADLRDRLFDPFVTTKAHGGGLGLALVQRIVLDHGGTVEAGDSSLGGARFTVCLPKEPRGRFEEEAG